MLRPSTFIRYMMYIAMAVIFSDLVTKYMPTKVEVTPSFLMLCGILAELLGWKYDYTEEKEETT